MKTIKITRYRSPAGDMILGSLGGKLCLCDWAVEKRCGAIDRRVCRHLNAEYEEGSSDIIRLATAQLDEYFAGERKEFSISLIFSGSPFQCRVWAALMKIPYGVTISYAEQARLIGNPRAVRAVASANAANPISIFVPCHRVIGSNRKLTGYGGGLDVKQKLLELEGRDLQLFGVTVF
ncbi:MAG: methylated-DNA--[protein]-cysteine S-methyltransferase [Prevotella sp.]|nr:methylated-DNA--[protein]-cysteine S-methyltransferase [Prevotella sp.]